METVPPVPAIPKVYGSPREVAADALFSDFGAEDLRLNDYARQIPQTTAHTDKPPKLMAPAYAFAQSNETNGQAHPSNRHHPQHVRLPPLNLQPLSDPTTAKIASLTSPTSSDGQNGTTPPPFHRVNKTPSTPLTASKATFSTGDPRFHYDVTTMPPLRSTTSYGEGRVHALARGQSENSSPNLFVTPTTSTPDGSESYATATLAAEAAAAGSPRRVRGTTTNEEGRSTGSAISPLPKAFASAAARFSNKSSPSIPEHATGVANPGKPRLVSIRGAKDTTPSSSSASLTRTQSTKESPGPSKISTNALAPMRKILGGRTSKTLLRTQSSRQDLDVELVAADDEMIKLASKKKDFERSAREVDELAKRAKPKGSISASRACRSDDLNIFEQGEVIDYKDVYFCGASGIKKRIGDLASQATNFGFDDDRGDYNIVLGDHLAYRYEVVDVLGKGSFGQVVRCIDHKNGKLVAVKIIRNKKRFHQQALVEVNILQRLMEWVRLVTDLHQTWHNTDMQQDPDNEHSMLTFTHSFYFRGHLCISTELLSINLYEFIKLHEFRGFSLRLIRRFTKQMLSSLCLLQGKNVIHCDLKPENILLAHPLRSEIKVIDFGSSCFENERVYTYIQSRFYRSPEVILGMNYGMPIDMWSIGCILAELYTGYPIFPGENEQEQLACIMEVFGPPEKHLVEASTRKKLFFDSNGKPRLTVNAKGKRRRPSTKTLQQALKCDDEAFLDFITKCLRWDPERRLKPDEAMQHPFVTGVKMRPATVGSALTSGSSSSPAKRHTFQAPLRIRPLPEAPLPSKTTVALPSARASPTKPQARRHSTISGTSEQNSKRTSMSGLAGSAVPSVVPRSVSSKADMAASAAAMATVSLSTTGS